MWLSAQLHLAGADGSECIFLLKRSCRVSGVLPDSLVVVEDLEEPDLAEGVFELVWVEPDGRGRRGGLDAAAEVAFEQVLPVRRFSSYKGQRHFPGLWWSATTGGHVGSNPGWNAITRCCWIMIRTWSGCLLRHSR